MKKLFKPALFVVLMSLTLGSTSNVFAATPTIITPSEKTSSEEAQKMINRLNEIKSMDASSMTRKQKKELRKEVKSIDRALNTKSGGVYISVGAIIIILLLLIILL